MGKKEKQLLEARPKFPGQVVAQVYTLEQLTALTSSAVVDVFASFSDTEPLSIREIAAELKKSTGTIGVHVETLLQAKLIIPVDTRKRHSRTETLYVHCAQKFQTKLEGQPWEHWQKSIEGLSSILRAVDRRNQEHKKTAFLLPEYLPWGRTLGRAIWLNRDNLEKFLSAISEFNDRMLELDESETEVRAEGEYIRLHTMISYYPEEAESKRRRKSLKKKSD